MVLNRRSDEATPDVGLYGADEPAVELSIERNGHQVLIATSIGDNPAIQTVATVDAQDVTLADAIEIARRLRYAHRPALADEDRATDGGPDVVLDDVTNALAGTADGLTREELARATGYCYETVADAVQVLVDADQARIVHDDGQPTVVLDEDALTSDGGHHLARIYELTTAAQSVASQTENSAVRQRVRLALAGLDRLQATGELREARLREVAVHLSAAVDAAQTREFEVPARNALQLLVATRGGGSGAA